MVRLIMQAFKQNLEKKLKIQYRRQENVNIDI